MRYVDFSIYLPFSAGKASADFGGEEGGKSLKERDFLNERPQGHSAFGEASIAPLPKPHYPAAPAELRGPAPG